MFEPGQSGNPSGRPKGAKNKVVSPVKAAIEELLSDQSNIEKLKTELNSLTGKDYLSMYQAFMPYIVPKLQATSLDIDLDKLDDQQLDELYNRIMESISK